MEKLTSIAGCNNFIFYCFETRAVKLPIEEAQNKELQEVFNLESTISLEDCKVICRELNDFELTESKAFDRTPLHKYFN